MTELIIVFILGSAFGYWLKSDDLDKSDKQPEFPKKEE